MALLHTFGRCKRAVVLGLCFVIVLGGCVSGPERLDVCPGQPDAEAALGALAVSAGNAVSLRANGQALLTYHVPDKAKAERHNLPMQMWFSPPTDISIHGSIAVDPRAVVIGSNEEQFWLALKPQEISSYYLGAWENARDFEGLMMSPRVILEALGIVVEPADEPNAALWSLANDGPYDILTRRNEAGLIIRRLYIHACDYLVHRIEYFDRRGKIAATAQLRDYELVAEGFRVPTAIRVVSVRPDGRKDSIDIDIQSTKAMELNEQQRQFLFTPPAADKFEHVYRYEEGQWVSER